MTVVHTYFYIVSVLYCEY